MTAAIAPGLVLAAPASGSGKTLVTSALLACFTRRGLRAAACKAGPDYIDPAFHAAASGRACRNLDPWAMRGELLAGIAAAAARAADLLLIEGVMGLFDGAADGAGSTADLAARFGWPVVLVVDGRGMGVSAAALVEGFRRFRADTEIAAVIFNRVAGPGHAAILRAALGPLGVPVLGCLPRDPSLELPRRHLGLVQAQEQAGLAALLGRAADWAEANLDLAALAALAQPSRLASSDPEPVLPPLGQRIALARDAAFAFAYPHLLEAWRAQGAEIVPFAPLADQPPDRAADAVYLPGGYPELHAGRLAACGRFMAGLDDAAGRGATIYGECGGYMVLGERLIDAEGVGHAMAGLLPLETSFAARRLQLGYRAARLVADGPLGRAGLRYRGHEFHYASVLREAAETPLFEAAGASGGAPWATGARRGRVMGSFLHLIDRAEDD